MSGSEPDALPLGDSPLYQGLYAFLWKKKERGDGFSSPLVKLKLNDIDLVKIVLNVVFRDGSR